MLGAYNMNMPTNQNRISTTNQPYLRITEVISDNKKRSKYELLSLARNTITAIQIFHNYFLSLYSKKYEEQMNKNSIVRLQEDHLSNFFKLFLNIFTLKVFLNITSNLTNTITVAIHDLVGITSSKGIDHLLLPYLKFKVNSLVEKYYEFFKYKDYVERARIVQDEINKLLAKLYSQLQDQQRFELIIKVQILPQEMDDKLLKAYIKENFKNICNIKLLQKSSKKEVLNHFHKTIKSHMFVKIPFIMETRNQDDNSIIMQKQSEEKYPILTNLPNYLQSHQTLPQIKRILDQICDNIIIKCNNFNKDTKTFYPNLSANSIYFDQKTLSPYLSNSQLILDAIGLLGKTKNFQLRLATEPTPNAINYEESYLQTIKQNKLLMQRKYYCPQENSGAQEHENEQPKTMTDIRSKEIILIEKIHVWRLVNVLYFTKYGRHFTNDYYNGKLNENIQNLSRNTKIRPFYHQEYRQKLKRAHQDLQAGILKLSKLFPQNSSIKQIPQQKFEFSLQNVNLFFKMVENDDSLFDSMKLMKIKSYIYERCLLIREINAILVNQGAFKKLSNPKKYIMMYCIGFVEEVYLVRHRRQKQYRLDKLPETPKLQKKKSDCSDKDDKEDVQHQNHSEKQQKHTEERYKELQHKDFQIQINILQISMNPANSMQ